MMTRYSSHCFWNSATFFLASSSSSDITSTFSLVSSILNNPVRSLVAWSSSSCRFSASSLGDKVELGARRGWTPRKGSSTHSPFLVSQVPVFLSVATTTLVSFLVFPSRIIANGFPTGLCASGFSSSVYPTHHCQYQLARQRFRHTISPLENLLLLPSVQWAEGCSEPGDTNLSQGDGHSFSLACFYFCFLFFHMGMNVSSVLPKFLI